MTTWPINYSDDGKELFWIDSRGRDKSAAIAENTKTGAVRVLAEDPKADINSLFLDGRTKRPVAAACSFDRIKWTIIDPRFASVFDILKDQLPGDIIFSSMSDNADKLIIAHVQDCQPLEYFCFDLKTEKTTRLFSAQPKLETVRRV